MTTSSALAGRYRLLRPLGKGSMGEVWAARDITLSREVAVKLIYEGSPELGARLKREATACGRLEHPNIVRVYDFGETDGGDPFLVMELLNGETLADRLERRHRLSVADAVTVALEVARALRAAHDAGIVHRDLKPANVFLCARAEGEAVKVLDFGVSKILTSFDMSVTTAGALVGSPAYMSPEQARALPDIDARSDLWSIGVLLFEMLTGTRPFAASTVMGVVTEILAGPLPSLSEAMPGVDPRLDAAVRGCLTRDVDRRTPSAAALIEGLAPVLSRLQMEARDAMEDMPTIVGHSEHEPGEDVKTIARPPAPESDEEDERETAVLRGHHIAAFRRDNRANWQAPPPAPSRPAMEGNPVDTAPLPPLATAVLPPGADVGSTLLLPVQQQLPVHPGHPGVALPEPAPEWENFDTLKRTPAVPHQDAESGRATLPPGWDRKHSPQMLWMTVVAGLVLCLVVFAGLSLLR